MSEEDNNNNNGHQRELIVGDRSLFNISSKPTYLRLHVSSIATGLSKTRILPVIIIVIGVKKKKKNVSKDFVLRFLTKAQVFLFSSKMLSGTTGNSLASSSHCLEATWEDALSHFRRALLECGSPLSVEHSQRLGLLFSKRVGDTEELKKWASIFDAEDVPTTALILKALVKHDQWQTAVQLLELNKDASTTKELSEVLAQNLTRIGLWQETLSLAKMLTPEKKSDSVEDSLELPAAKSSALAESANRDSFQMATNPAFLPDEERTCYCGFVAAVAQGFPRRQDWEKAIEVLHELEKVTDCKTQTKLFEYEVARAVHQGHQYKKTVELSRTDMRFRTSPSLLRSLLHCALALGDGLLSIRCLELLASFGPGTVSVKMFESACKLFISGSEEPSRDDLLRFESVTCNCADCIRDVNVQKLVAAFSADYDLKIPVFVSTEKNTTLSDNHSSKQTATQTVTQLDRVATTLLSQGRWKEALQVADQIVQQNAQDDTERVIIEMLRESSGSWEKTLQFFEA